MRILFLLEDDFPETGACTCLINNIIFCGGLQKKAEAIEVLAIKSKYTPLKKETINSVTVHNGVLMSKVSNQQYKKIFMKHPVKALMGFAEKIFLKLDKKAINIRSSHSIEKDLKRISAEDFDVVVAVMGRFEVASAIMNYKIKHPKVKVVLYQVDPCLSNDFFDSSTYKERLDFEKKLYEISDRIITTPVLLEESKQIYPQKITDKMVSMEFPNVVPVKASDINKNDFIRCLFTGNIYGNFRNPQYTLRLFDKSESSIKLEVIGSVKPELKKEFELHNVLYHGPKSLDETRKELLSADILVNIGNKMLNQVPSKLFEYISYGKPIVNVCKNRNCPTLPYLAKYPYALNLFEEEENFEEQAKKLNSFILENYQKRMLPDETTKAFETCTPQYCANQMLEIFKSLT